MSSFCACCSALCMSPPGVTDAKPPVSTLKPWFLRPAWIQYRQLTDVCPPAAIVPRLALPALLAQSLPGTFYGTCYMDNSGKDLCELPEGCENTILAIQVSALQGHIPGELASLQLQPMSLPRCRERERVRQTRE